MLLFLIFFLFTFRFFKAYQKKTPAKCESYSRTKGSVSLSTKPAKMSHLFMGAPLNLFILFLEFDVKAATEVHIL